MRALRLPVLSLVLLLGLAGCRSEAKMPTVTVYKTPTCGCCGLWAEHMAEAGFEVKTVDVASLDDVKARLGVPNNLASCHTAVVGDYVVEGHVPAKDVERLLAEAPDAAGLAVPGMPFGSPGMEVEGRQDEQYDVFLFTRDGGASVFSHN